VSTEDRNMKTLLFGIHCHQPVDNFDWAVFEAIERSYLPFLEAVEPYKEFRFAVHFSGWLLQKIETDKPELFALMQRLAKRGQIEMVSGGFYEPILASIPSKDRRDQIRKLNAYIKKHFNQTPKGVWLTERVWDDSIIGDLCACGIEYTVVDDYHFLRSGFKRSDCEGYYYSENGGERVAVFPISKPLRYALPFEDASKSIEAIKAHETSIHFDDGEKFGLWPKTYEWVYEKGWLESFLKRFEEEDGLQALHFKEYMKTQPAKGLAYLPNVSYFEMGEWSLNVEGASAIERASELLADSPLAAQSEMILGGGTWKNFFVKYRESNHIHKRMLMLSNLRKALGSKKFDDALFRAQTNDVLWHGVFGGLYLPNLRDNAYRYLIRAHAMVAKKLDYKSLCSDIDADGYDEVLLHNEKFCMLFSTAHGGQLVELGLFNSEFNLQNTLARRREFYHEALLEQSETGADSDEGIDTIHAMQHTLSSEERDALVFDWHERGSFIDHFSDHSFDLHRFYRSDYFEMGDFANQPYRVEALGKSSVTLCRDGGIYTHSRFATRVTKGLRLSKNGIKFHIEVGSDYSEEMAYIVEFNLHFAEPKSVLFNGNSLEKGMVIESDTLTMHDPYLQSDVVLSFEQHGTFYLHAISTVSQSEKGVDLTVQGVAIGFKVAMRSRLNLDGKLMIREGSRVTV